MADNESEELYVEDLDLGDISGAGLSGLFAKSDGAGELPPGIEPDEEESSVEPVGEDPASVEKPQGRRGRLLGRLGDLRQTFTEELEKAKAEESTPEAAVPPVDDAMPGPLELPDGDDEPGPAQLPIPGAEELPADPTPPPSFDAEEELIYEEPEEPAPAPAPRVAARAADPAPSILDEGRQEDQKGEGGLLELLRRRWAMAQASKEAARQKTGPEGAGVDLSRPGDSPVSSFFGRLAGHGPKAGPASAPLADGESGFAALLKPLPAGEVAMLQAELAGDETVFARIDRQRRDMANRQLFGFLIGLACLLFFAISDGHHYLVDVLNHAAQPNWIPDTVRGDTAGAGLYALGLLVPLASLFIIADGVRYLMSAAAMRRLDDLLLGMVAGACSLGAIYSCSDGQVISGVLLVVAYWVVHLAARLLGVKRG